MKPSDVSFLPWHGRLLPRRGIYLSEIFCRNCRYFKVGSFPENQQNKTENSIAQKYFSFPRRGIYLLPATTKLGQGNVFTGICDSVQRGVCLSACWDTTPQEQTPPEDQTPLGADTPPDHTPWEQTPPGSRHPQEQTPSQTRHPPWSRHPPWTRHPPDQTPPWEQTPPRPDTPWEVDAIIQSMSSRYASYWNAFLSEIFCQNCHYFKVGSFPERINKTNHILKMRNIFEQIFQTNKCHI